MILMIDNYDSFTYNLVDLLRVHNDVEVVYPDDPHVLKYEPSAVVLSPGPGHPNDNNLLTRIIEHYHDLPILGICLGAQALYHYYGGTVDVGERIVHGKIDHICFEAPSKLYDDISEYSDIMRYHSLICLRDTLPDELVVTGSTDDCIQSFEHRMYPHYGIQYHPESFASPDVAHLITNFMNIIKLEETKDDVTL
ncbi:anthranilate synthase component II [Staphylococcus americanisciuri]|uniref:Aminodeoxychorismate/anthranilate synthase component II n=1 Tax=Staphylococcus americanisciuri TaxID=2973940 RepID=A0ABT2F1Y7_9STAP|nr:aminodeoxychorismate/anthranilate synthase component II [Staphylococcus americanisciuri]MCS4486163.1 aminodeoxychorismate/anthranilate synthase component II [Staphylococcus americanisciuri]